MTEAPTRQSAVVVVGPRVQPDQGNPIRGDGRRKRRLHVGITVARERRDGHGVVAGIFAVAGADIGVESIQTMARSSPYLSASTENGATLTEHSPPRVAIRAGLC
jgi:hypothetical protein